MPRASTVGHLCDALGTDAREPAAGSKSHFGSTIIVSPASTGGEDSSDRVWLALKTYRALSSKSDFFSFLQVGISIQEALILVLATSVGLVF